MPQLAIIADDLTGAADTGACFASAGLATVIPFGGAPVPAADVVVLSTETRDLAAADAADIVLAATERIVAGDSANPRWVYKKIDSALRGHPRDELLAVMTALDATRALVAPAFPAEGRTTRDGQQRVDGVPLAGSRLGEPGAVSDLVTLFQDERRWPVSHLDLATIRGTPDVIRRHLDDPEPGIVVADAETDDDLLALARAASGSPLRVLCGAAGFARQLSLALPLRHSVRVPIGRQERFGPILVVAGSQHDATARQIAVLRAAGTPIVVPAQEVIDDRDVASDGIVAEIASHLAAGHSTVLTTVGMKTSPYGGGAVAARLAEIAAAPEVRPHIGGLVLTGGDVATAVCAALRATALWLGGEITPGQPLGWLAGGALPGIPVATKAGSFGDDHALLAGIDHVKGILLRRPES